MAMSRQTRSFLTMIVLALVAGGVAAFAYFGVFQADEKAQDQKDKAAQAFDFDKAKVKSLALTAKGQTVTMQKDGDGWKIVSPVETAADKFAVDPIVDKLHDLKSKATVADDQKRAGDFGLDHPQFEVKATLDGGQTLELAVGSENKFDSTIYYSKGGDQHVYQADDGLKYPFNKTLFDLRDKTLVATDTKDVQAFTVEANGSDWSAERDGDGWKLTVPVQDKADKSVVEGVINRLHGVKAKAFAEEKQPADAAGLAKYGFDKPVAVVTYAIGKDRAKSTLQFGQVGDKGKEKTYARLLEGSPVWEIDGSLLKDLTKTETELRDKTVAGFDKDSVAKLEIQPAGGKLVTVTRTKVKKPGQVVDSDQFAVDGKGDHLKEWKLSSALYTLSSLKGTGIADDHAADLSKYGLDKPQASYTAYDKDGKKLASILFGSVSGTTVYAAAAGSTRVFDVSKSTFDDLPKTVADVTEQPAATTAAAKSGKSG